MKGFLIIPVFVSAVLGASICARGQIMRHVPKKPVVCYQNFENRHDHVGVSQYFTRLRNQPAGRKKSSTIFIEYINFPVDNLAKQSLQFAVDIWESELTSAVPIHIRAEWRPLETGVLGQALWGSAYANFDGAQHMNTFYPVALAEKITGKPINADSDPDIVASFNSNGAWYFGTDGKTPGGKMDFVTIALHEIAHGLGFTDTYDTEGTDGRVGLASAGLSVPFVFDVFVENAPGDNLLHAFPSPSKAMGDALRSEALYFNSPLAVKALTGTRPELYAPSTFNNGSSISHLDEGTFNAPGDANRLMTPQISFAESIHDPGPLLRAMLSDMGWVNTFIDHTPLKDTERRDGQPYPVSVKIVSDNGYDPGSVELNYTLDGINFTPVQMTPSGAADEFTSSLPGTVVNRSYGYFITVVDVDTRKFASPGQMQTPGQQPQQGVHFFTAGQDMSPPEIVHESVDYIFNSDQTLEIVAHITDNLGISEAIVEYFVEGGQVQTRTMTAGLDPDEYTATIDLPSLNIGDEVQYRIMATDNAGARNSENLPSSGYFAVAVIGIKPVQDSYHNDFDVATSDFFGNNFRVETPAGFDNGAIHSDHPYNNGSGPNHQSNYTFQLQIPVRIDANNPIIRFDEIVLVEPGEDGSAFGEDGFYDYVVVEGSADGGVTWLPFTDGYDSRAISVWLDRYEAGISQDNSTTTGDPALFRTRTISMITEKVFGAGDEVLIRFRLFADQLAHGWGWAIDNLYIQSPVTGVDDARWAGIDLYPQPVEEDLVVSIGNLPPGAVSISLADLQGRQVYIAEFDSGTGGENFQETLRLHSLRPGCYVMTVRAADRAFTRKVFKVSR